MCLLKQVYVSITINRQPQQWGEDMIGSYMGCLSQTCNTAVVCTALSILVQHWQEDIETLRFGWYADMFEPTSIVWMPGVCRLVEDEGSDVKKRDGSAVAPDAPDAAVAPVAPVAYHRDTQYASPVKLQSFSNHFPSFCQSCSSTLSIETFEFSFVL